MNIMNNSQSNNPQRFLDYSLFNYLSRKIQPLLYIKRDNSLNPLLSPEQLALGFTVAFTPDNRPYFPTRKNSYLISCLKELGFFDVFCTNCAGDDSSAFGVYLSQVSMFLQYGIQWVRSSFKISQHSTEIHHINSNVLDSRTTNMAVVSSTVHSFLSTIQVGKDIVSRPFLSSSIVIYNPQGVILKGQQALCKLGWLVHQTVLRTKLWLKAVIYCAQPVSELEHSFGFDTQVIQELNGTRTDLDYIYTQSINSSPEQHVLTMSWNWLLKVKVLSLPSILSNLKSAASLFLRGLLGTVDSTLLIQTLSIA